MWWKLSNRLSVPWLWLSGLWNNTCSWRDHHYRAPSEMSVSRKARFTLLIDPSDPTAAQECQESCFIDFSSCQDGCSSYDCQNQCVEKLTDCNKHCPCNEYCPDGCANCDHPTCYCDPDSNADALECFKYYEHILNGCLESCSSEDKERLCLAK